MYHILINYVYNLFIFMRYPNKHYAARNILSISKNDPHFKKD